MKVTLIDRLKAVETIIAKKCEEEERECAYKELSSVILEMKQQGKSELNNGLGFVGRWTRVGNGLPAKEGGKQKEVVFYAKPYEWWTGIFTPKGKVADASIFQAHRHWESDEYRTVDKVIAWMYLSNPLPTLLPEAPGEI